jgi:diguanylate cyclase (GGDEF)-like protein
MVECSPGEAARLSALHRYDILDTEPEEAFDRITRLAKTVLQMPMVLISLVDSERQWFKSRQGMTMRSTPRGVSFCTYTIRNNGPFIVADAHADPRFVDNPLVRGEPFIRYYIGIPLRMHDGCNIGALCGMDTRVRDLAAEQVKVLEDLARLVVDELELRLIASVDSLTGALTRRTFRESASRDIAHCIRSGARLSCALIDLDHFNVINDRYGQGAGDAVLQRVIAICQSEVRASDYIGRVGGEEFAVILPDTELSVAIELAERLRCAIGQYAIEVAGETIGVSASIGVVERGSADDKIETLLQNAATAMYLAKSGGRNRTVCFPNERCTSAIWKDMTSSLRARTQEISNV